MPSEQLTTQQHTPVLGLEIQARFPSLGIGAPESGALEARDDEALARQARGDAEPLPSCMAGTWTASIALC